MFGLAGYLKERLSMPTYTERKMPVQDYEDEMVYNPAKKEYALELKRQGRQLTFPEARVKVNQMPAQDYEPETLYNPKNNSYLYENKRLGKQYEFDTDPVFDPLTKLREFLRSR